MSGRSRGRDANGPRIRAGIIGSGNIGTDLMLKLLRSPLLEPCIEAGIDPASKGLHLAREKGIRTSTDGIAGLLAEDVAIVFDASGAQAHLRHAPLLKEAGKIAIDLTPAAVGPCVVPHINLRDHLNASNVNLVTCGAQATVPIVRAISRIAAVKYAEIVSSLASKSAGLATRQNIDEFTHTTARSLETLGGSRKGKAIIILNPAVPPISMQNTIYAVIEDGDEERILRAITAMVGNVQSYVPGYRLKHQPRIEGDTVIVQIQVEGVGDYLPKYAGNLDIMTAAAVAVGEEFARKLLQERG